MAARVLAAVGGVVLFFSVASIIDPTHAPARTIQPGGAAGTFTTGAAGFDGLLCTLIGANFTIEVYAGDPEPVYTVYDAAGNVLAERAPKDEIYRIDPSLDVDMMLGPAIGVVDDTPGF